MSIVSRLRKAGADFLSRHLPGDALSFSAELPGSSGPLWQMRLDIDSSPQADGKLLRLRAHWRLSLRRPARSAAPAATGWLARAGQLLERRAQSPALQPLLEPFMDRDVSSWMELRASDAALDGGSQALVPEQLAMLGAALQADRPVQTWAGELPGARGGFGVLSLMRVDKRQLPGWLQQQLGPSPFQMAATLATAVEEPPSPR